jgi:hypothetical protein
MRPGVILIFFLILLAGCREPYQPPTILAQSNLMVVDAFLDGTNATCTVVLSRSQNVSDSETKPMEKKATVQLEDSDGNVYVFKETSDGNYNVSGITIDTQMKYKLKIKTEAGKSYASDLVEIKNTPPIDSVTWKATEPGLQFYISTHDDEKKSIYYQYRFVETWEYVAPLYSAWEIVNGVAVPRSNDIYHCWSTAPSTEISIATSVKLSEDVISNFPFYLIAKPSEKYLIRYSILVKQNVLTVEAYNYWQQLRKDTEKIGTLFDPQPSQILSNVQNVDNADEPVLGYFNAGMTTEKRIFVSGYDMPRGWFFSPDGGKCQADSQGDTIKVGALRGFSGLLINGLYDGGTSPYAFIFTPTLSCADCRTAGGTTTKPDFW